MVKTISINAFGCNPNFGSERGLGWIWLSELSKSYDIVCYTEEDSRQGVESQAKLPNVEFVYVNISRLGHRLIYDQGNYLGYLFYIYYQWVVFFKSLFGKKTDIYHHLNMIGYRIPGLFWLTALLRGGKSVWGPIGGINVVPFRVYKKYGLLEMTKSNIKNFINILNILSPNVLLATTFYNKRVFVQQSLVSKLLFASNFYPETFIRDTTLKTQNKTIDFVIVGKFDYRKNHLLAIDSLVASGFSNNTIFVVGDGSFRSSIESYARKNCINMTFTGNIQRAKVIEILAKTKVLINASVDEGTSHAVIEAISQNCKIAGFTVGGHVQFQPDFLNEIKIFDSYSELVKKLANSIHNAYMNEYDTEVSNYSPDNFAHLFYE